MKKFSFTIIKAQEIENIIWSNFPKIFDMVKHTYLAHEKGLAFNPPSSFLRFTDMPDARIISLPAAINDGISKISGLKWIASNPQNIHKGFPRASAVIILNDYETGYPFACLEGSLISAMRTACSAVLAADSLIKNRTIKQLGIVGNGPIAQQILKCFFKMNFEISEILLYDTSYERSELFNENLKAVYKNKVIISKTKEDLISSSDVIVLATTAKTPYINDGLIFSHHPIVLNISLRDLSPDILIKSNNIVDDIQHVLTANTSPHLSFEKYGHKEFINGTLAQLLTGSIKTDPLKTTIFSPMGMGILDIALANAIYELSKKELTFDDFFNI